MHRMRIGLGTGAQTAAVRGVLGGHKGDTSARLRVLVESSFLKHRCKPWVPQLPIRAKRYFDLAVLRS